MDFGEDISFSFEDLEFIEGSENELEGGTPAGSSEGNEDDNQGDPEGDPGTNNGAVADDSSQEGVGDDNAGESGEDSEQSSPKLYHTLAEVLREQGVLSPAEGSVEINDIDGLVAEIKKEITQQEFADLPESAKEAILGIREGANLETATVYKNNMETLEALDQTALESNQQARFDLICESLIAQGVNKERAENIANRSFDAGTDMQDALEGRTILINNVKKAFEAAKKEEVQAKKEADNKILENRNKLESTILEDKNLFGGLSVTDTVRKEILQNAQKVVGKDPVTNKDENLRQKYARENPVEYAAKLEMLFKLTNGFTDLTYFTKKASSKNLKNLERAIKESTHVAGGGNPSFADDAQISSLEIGDLVLPE